jgi:dihydrolipoamide dehydrogenase
MANYDVCIIGAGPGGYVAAIRAAQLGGKVCVVEKDEVGGTCLNRGCIPTKALLNAIEVLSCVRDAGEFGINVTGYSFDFARMMSRKEEVVKRLRDGIGYLFKTKKIELVKGTGKFLDPNTVEAAGRILKANSIIIATGSVPMELPFFKYDGTGILSSDDILKIPYVPESLMIVGGGVIGCEFACIFVALGTEVTIIEMLEQIVPTEDKEIAKRLETILRKKGVKILTKTKIEKIEKRADGAVAKLSDGTEVKAQTALVCVGRRPDSKDAGIENAGIKTERGRVVTDEFLRTNLPGVFAIGDVIGGYLLAHVASYEGIIAAENIFGKSRKADYTVVPNCIFTDPEIASVGLTEDKARTQGYDVKAGKFPFIASGKAQAMRKTEGFVKIVTDTKTGVILGGQIIGPHATDLIAEVAVAMGANCTAGHLAEIIHAHPTLAESIMEAAHSVNGRAIHI